MKKILFCSILLISIIIAAGCKSKSESEATESSEEASVESSEELSGDIVMWHSFTQGQLD
ncbi:Sugar ABC transporter substrate-binding protein OS=Lysinibacillus sphaericus OX=1421 GN=LS41612_01320 PE=4 SV=1 [Lysinibacillus sphaericus]